MFADLLHISLLTNLGASSQEFQQAEEKLKILSMLNVCIVYIMLMVLI